MAICMVDVLSTLILISTGLAEEGNPFMEYVLQNSLASFIIVKLGTVALFATVCEWYRARNPVFVERALRITIIAYIGLYFSGLLVINGQSIL